MGGASGSGAGAGSSGTSTPFATTVVGIPMDRGKAAAARWSAVHAEARGGAGSLRHRRLTPSPGFFDFATDESIARCAYIYADAMLAARKEKP